jgi:uncharacterized protein YyaL (SSP411 family)
MASVQILTGHGGWPMTVWLTPGKEPFYGGTYYPARDGDRGAPVGFFSMLKRLRQVYDTQSDRVASSTRELSAAVRRQLAPAVRGDAPTAALVRNAVRDALDDFDPREGGVDGAPKFPSSFPIRLMLRYHRRTGDSAALDAARLTLRKMAAGGIYDHVAGGFHRYSTDAYWLVPHFEKMLYDNALLVVAYLEAWQATGDADFRATAADVLRYVERDMTSPEGLFYSATDADSLTPDGHMDEGWFFTWTPDEVRAVLSADAARLVILHHGLTPHGNFEGRNILQVKRPLEATAREMGMDPNAAAAMYAEARERLYNARRERPAPLRDEKVQTSWNSLMISAFAKAARILGEPRYADVADRAADALLSRMVAGDLVAHSYKDGRASRGGYLDDSAFLVQALLDLYEATFDARRLEAALRITDALNRRFWDDAEGGYFMTAHDDEELLARQKPSYDGAEPSGNSVAALNLLRLSAYTTDDAHRQRAVRCLAAFGRILEDHPRALSEMMLAVDAHLDRPLEIAMVGRETQHVEPFLSALRSVFLPNAALAVVDGDEGGHADGFIPWIADKPAPRDGARAYVCQRGVCRLPADDPSEFVRQIREAAPYSD